MDTKNSQKWLFGFGPLILLGIFVVLFLLLGPLGVLKQDLPPIEEVSIQKVRMEKDRIIFDVLNDGPDPVTISQVLVNSIYWQFSMTPSNTIERLKKATVTVDFPWEKGEPTHLFLLSSNGVGFDHEIELATLTPKPTLKYLLTFASLGIYVGVVPVFLGLLWLPFLRRLSGNGFQFFLALTVGLLVFLGIDALHESFEAIEKTAKVQQGLGVALIGVFATWFGLSWVGEWTGRRGSQTESAMTLAYLIAFGIGVHNLGEGLAIGGAYSSGALGLGAMLVIGFMLHNVTEGIAIIAPIAKTGATLKQLIVLGAVAGIPTIFGTWVGGFIYSPIWTVLFLAIGAGAVFQVVFQILNQMRRQMPMFITTPFVSGFLVGVVLMVLTSRWVV